MVNKMNLSELLKEKKTAVGNRWLNAVYSMYSDEAAKFFSREKDPHANPVGHALRQGTAVILDEIAGGMDAVRICASLEEIMKIRAVQQFTAMQAVSFIFLLKQAAREEFGAHAGAIAELDTRTDQVMLFAFDVYMRCREQVYQMRVDELKRSVAAIMRGVAADVDFDPMSVFKDTGEPNNEVH